MIVKMVVNVLQIMQHVLLCHYVHVQIVLGYHIKPNLELTDQPSLIQVSFFL
jgi:hypothetical protein